MLDPLRRLLRKRSRVGHTGTLDPFATGILLVLIGDATRLSSMAMRLPKHYAAIIRFGEETDTLDPDGRVVRSADPGSAPPRHLESAVQRFVGRIDQAPPAFSAVKIGGDRAYRLARQGKPSEPAPRSVTIHEIEVTEVNWPEVRLRVRCGPGTYLRSLARDLGNAVGIPASLAWLRRAQVGPFTQGDGIVFDPGEEIDPQLVLSALRSPLELTEASGIPTIHLPRSAARTLAAGGDVAPAAAAGLAQGTELAVAFEDATTGSTRMIGLGLVNPWGRIAPRTILAGARRRLEQDRAIS